MRRPAEVPEAVAHPDWANLLNTMLTVEGSTSDTYSRMYRYSMGNIALLMMQGVTPQPVANYERWRSVNRHVKRGSSAYYILRPITVKLDELDENGNEVTIQRFKPVKSVFPLSMTEGEPLPELEHPSWSKARALGSLAITETSFETFEANSQGYSVGNEIAINPIARYPHKTLMHETAHVVLGHTTGTAFEEYQRHRGLAEFQAEATAHIVMNELGLAAHMDAAESRAYVQNWLSGNKPSDRDIRAVFAAADKIVRAGLEDQAASLSAADSTSSAK